MIQPHETWNILDSTKIQEFMDCPRMYFYRYMLGWQAEDANVHLVFGEAWHRAMEQLLRHGYGEKSIIEAHRLLSEYFSRFFPEMAWSAYHPKTPDNALLALIGYVQEYANDKHEVLYTEIAGTVPIREDKVLYFRQDSILRTEDGIKSREHKTGSQLSRMWLDQWNLSFQVGTYHHVLFCLYPASEVWGVEINGAIFSKSKVQFQRVPVRRDLKSMQNWFWNAQHYVSMIEWEMTRLLTKCSKDDDVMMAFPMNTQSCTKYFGCRFVPFCMAWPNPLRSCEEPPPGFKIEWWNPANIRGQSAVRLWEEGLRIFTDGRGVE